MAHVWQGVINEYRDRLPFADDVKAVTLGEGGTPLIHAPALSAETGNTVYLKFEGCLLYTSPSPRDQRGSRMPSSA